MDKISVPNIRKGVYKHYKGDLMEVYGVALHSETLEPFVTYRHVAGERAGEANFWVRPYEMFLETVEFEGKTMPRFEFLRDI